MTAVVPGVVLVDRFRLDAHAPDIGPGVIVGVDQGSSLPIVAFEVPKAQVHVIRPAVGLDHAHLATLLGDVVLEGHHVLVAARVTGPTVADALAAYGPLAAPQAVKCGLRLLDAVLTLHEAGACHGLIHPRSVILQAEGRSSPVLGWAPLGEGESLALPPEHDPDAQHSPADDGWALGALLVQLLTTRAPPLVGVVSPDDLIGLGVEDAELAACLQHVLHADAGQRGDLQELKRELARWFAKHAGERTEASGAFVMPPPLPPSEAPPAVSLAPTASVHSAQASRAPGPAQPPRSRRFVPVFAALAVGAGLLAAWGVSSLVSKPRVIEIVDAGGATQPTEPETIEPAAVSLSAVPVTGEAERPVGTAQASCVADLLPKDSFVKTPRLDWLCSERDVREGSAKLRVAVVEGAGGARVTEAMRIFSKLGWYEMAAFALVRSGCCPSDAEPIVAPEPADGCDPLVGALQDLSKAALSGQETGALVERVGGVFACESGKNRASLFRRATAPQNHEQAAFRELLKNLATQ
ncbi:MAG: hypothetical protein KF718_05585 [Polyangiaceae bacterium]|nr:hypothetical protein [Polyangiaceae bacterium]